MYSPRSIQKNYYGIILFHFGLDTYDKVVLYYQIFFHQSFIKLFYYIHLILLYRIIELYRKSGHIFFCLWVPCKEKQYFRFLHLVYVTNYGTIFYLRFQVLMVASMKTTAVWNMVPCNLIEVDQHFRGSMHLRNISLLLRVYTAPYPRRLSSLGCIRI
jgi:hypothetical protein